MALKNTQYDEIMREYYRKQTEDRHEQRNGSAWLRRLYRSSLPLTDRSHP